MSEIKDNFLGWFRSEKLPHWIIVFLTLYVIFYGDNQCNEKKHDVEKDSIQYSPLNKTNPIEASKEKTVKETPIVSEPSKQEQVIAPPPIKHPEPVTPSTNQCRFHLAKSNFNKEDIVSIVSGAHIINSYKFTIEQGKTILIIDVPSTITDFTIITTKGRQGPFKVANYRI